MELAQFHQRIFVMLLALITVAFLYVLFPLSAAIFWAFIIALLFNPLYERILQEVGQRRNLAALLALLLSLLVAIIPLVLLGLALLREGASVYKKLDAGQVDFSESIEYVYNALPAWADDLLGFFNISDIYSLQNQLSIGLMDLSRNYAGRIFTYGQNIVGFVIAFVIMLYLLFFFFRDGRKLSESIQKGIPLNDQRKHELLGKFTGVIRATVKGNLIVALIQGVLGGVIFWILGIPAPVLWGALMAFLSLFPAGSGVIWLPAAIILMVRGSYVKGIILVVFGAVVIGLIDNILRPILVGKDTQMPDYVVLVSTLGGLTLFGLNGFIIGPVIAALFITAWKLFSEKNS